MVCCGSVQYHFAGSGTPWYDDDVISMEVFVFEQAEHTEFYNRRER